MEEPAAGELALSEGQISRGQATFEPLATAVEWFVEAVFDGPVARVTLAGGNYGKATSLKAALDVDSLKETAKGSKTAVRLEGSGLAPAVDELSLARCGDEPPDYEAQLVDLFDRADSMVVGEAQVPPGKAWVTEAASVRIVDGALEVRGNQSATIPVRVSTSGLRVRTTVMMVGGGTNPYLWADVNYNVLAGTHGLSLPGYWVWGPPNGGELNTTIFRGAGAGMKHSVSIAPDVPYFVQLDRDGDIAVLTVREQSFTGPILATEFNSGLLSKPDTGEYFTVADEGGDGIRFDEIRVDNYPLH